MSSFILSTSSSFSRAELIAKMKMAMPHMANVAYIIYLVALGSNSILMRAKQEQQQQNERWQKKREREVEQEQQQKGTEKQN